MSAHLDPMSTAPPGAGARIHLRPALATWAVPVLGAVVLVLLGVLLPFAIPAAPARAVPAAVLEAEQARTGGAEESVRRSLNEAVDDLVVASRTAVDGGARAAVLAALVEERGRYHSVAWVDGGGIVDSAGPEFPVPDGLPDAQQVRLDGALDGEPFVTLSAPAAGRPGEWIVAWYDAQYLSFPLEAAGPGDRWLLDDQNQVLGANQGFVALEQAPAAAGTADAARSEGALAVDEPEEQRVVSAAPLDGPGPAGSLGWAVVTASDYEGLALTDTSAHGELVMAGWLTAVVALVMLGWFLVVVALPVHHLAEEATAVADGQLTAPVLVRRYDEVGVIARNVDRIRRLLRGEQLGDPRNARTASGGGE